MSTSMHLAQVIHFLAQLITEEVRVCVYPVLNRETVQLGHIEVQLIGGLPEPALVPLSYAGCYSIMRVILGPLVLFSAHLLFMCLNFKEGTILQGKRWHGTGEKSSKVSLARLSYAYFRKKVLAFRGMISHTGSSVRKTEGMIFMVTREERAKLEIIERVTGIPVKVQLLAAQARFVRKHSKKTITK